MPFNVKDRGFVSLLIVLIVLSMIASGAGIVYFLGSNKSISTSPPRLSSLPPKLPVKVSIPSPPLISSISPTLTSPAVSLNTKYILERKENDKTEVLFAISNEALVKIVRWNNLIIFSDGGQNDKNYPPKIEIKSHDINTGETIVIFDSTTSRDQFNPSKDPPDSLSDLMVIDNTLYFSLGGYLLEGAVFWLDLPPLGKPKKLISVRNGSVTKLKEWYFVIGGEGDSCWLEKDFYLLDPKTKAVKKIVNAQYGCNVGEESLGLSNDGKMIMAYHGRQGNDPYQGNYEYIASLEISNPDNKKIIISREKMPNNVSQILYSEEKNQLLMIGDEIYLYKVAEDQLSKIVNAPEGVRLYETENAWQKEDKVCLSGEKNSQYVAKYELDLVSKTLTKMDSDCDIISTTEKTYDVKRLIDSLRLPANYQLITK